MNGETGRESNSDDPAASFAKLLQTIQRLRAPDGCAWDRAQTPTTLRPSLVEEVWETVSAIDARDEKNLEEELGDLYLLVTMVAWMKEQEGTFTVSSVLHRIHEKLVRRHPHVFANASAGSVKEILVRWDEIKAAEKGTEPAADSVLDHLPGSAPAPGEIPQASEKSGEGRFRLAFRGPRVGQDRRRDARAGGSRKGRCPGRDRGGGRRSSFLGDQPFPLPEGGPFRRASRDEREVRAQVPGDRETPRRPRGHAF